MFDYIGFYISALTVNKSLHGYQELVTVVTLQVKIKEIILVQYLFHIILLLVI
jgi:hypothetical protein